MSATVNVAVAATIMVFVAPALSSAQAPNNQQQWAGNATLSAGKSSRTARRGLPSTRVSRATDLHDHIIAPDGRDLGTDPDGTIRFQLRRDPSVPGGGSGM